MGNERRTTDRSTRVTRAIGQVTGWLGSFPAILLSVAVVLLWTAGAFFVQQRFANEIYQLVINTTTTVVTFIMVFIIQNTQNRDGRAIQTKLDAQSEALARLIRQAGGEGSEDLLVRLVGVEDAPEAQIKSEQDHVRDIASRSAEPDGPPRPARHYGSWSPTPSSAPAASPPRSTSR